MKENEAENNIRMGQSQTAWQRWLSDSHSFMQRLQAHGVDDAEIKVLYQDWQMPLLEESELLGLPSDKNALIREVLIYSPRRPEKYWMFARTVFPPETLTGEEQALAHLGNHSLGSILFKHPDMQRSAFEFFYLTPENYPDWHSKAVNAVNAANQIILGLWMRRSVFTVDQKKLLLNEIFFPDVLIL